MTSRIPVSPATHARFQDFARGLGTTFDEALNFVLDLTSDQEDSMLAGRQLRPKYQESKDASAGDSTKDESAPDTE